ncbi:MAG: hypothetical protein KKD38_00210, partial [Candidatus Delongbacteria bacterium]|nr:hypothetical protein [Candidatus Delongbacteria bacterium]MCG2761335.1 hypothetical protein [Candidatus Delongbacteria bacterium]
MASGSELTPFSSPVIDVTNPTSIIAASDVYFFNSQIDLCSVSSFDLSAGFKLSLDGCSFIRGIIIGEDVSVPTSSLEMSNSAYIYGITASNLNLLGEIVVREPVTFEGNTINKGKLYPAINSIIYLKDNFTNEGSIDNGLNLMTINVSGDITNSGTWTNNHTKLVGSAEQHVLLVNDMTINNELFYFTSELSTAPFQWYYNSEILDSPDFTGETSQEMQMYQKVMGPAYYGTYYCATGE